MAGKFVNSTHNKTVTAVTKGMKDILNNPYYKWTNRPPTMVIYYNRDSKASTLDEASGLEEAPIGYNSPAKYNKIKDFYIYGLEQMQVAMEHGEFGAETQPFAGEAVILPNTITPYPGDMFEITYLKEQLLFKITGISHDTLDTGANIYKINYMLSDYDKEDLKHNLNHNYTMLIENVGTTFNPVLRDETLDWVKKMENTLEYLREYFINLFYNSRVQTFTFLYHNRYFYDPFMTEFLIRSKVINGGGSDYVFLDHIINESRTFSLDYDRTIFRCFEKEDFDNLHRYNYKAIGNIIDDPTSVFYTRPEQYFRVSFAHIEAVHEEIYGLIPCFDNVLIESIENKTSHLDSNAIYNIIIKSISGEELVETDLTDLEYMDLESNPKLFYTIPLTLYCLERLIKREISVTSSDKLPKQH